MKASFERKIEKDINAYLDDADAPILLVDGARQVGKTYIVEKIGQSRFEHFVSINMVEDKQGDRLFEDVNSTRDFYLMAQSIHGGELGNKENTLIFIDEIQEYPQLFTLLKFFRQEKRYRFIASGSLLGVTLQRTSSIPIGSMQRIRMYPMDFEEFLWSKGISKEMIDDVREHVRKRDPISGGVHRLLLREFKDYLICGGLPYCVSDYIDKNDIISLRKIQNDIYSLYSDDASKYDMENRLHTRAIYDLIPSTVENKKKRIRLKDIEDRPYSKYSEYQEDFESLISSGIVLEAKCSADPRFPLKQTVKNSMLKLYMNDVGLLSAVLFHNNIKPLLDDEPHVNLGNVYETVAAEILSSKNESLYYCDNKKLGEVDFLIDDYESLSIIALEIKSGKDYKIHSALDNLMKSGNPPTEAIVLSNNGTVEHEGRITYLPIYALSFI